MDPQKKIVCQYYTLYGLFSFFGLSLVSGIYVTFLLGNGLSLAEANSVNAIFWLCMFAFEIPTGAFADTFGRKWSFMAALAIVGVAKLMYGAAVTKAGFIAAEIVAAMGVTFYTGAFDSWFKDSMKHYGNNTSLSREIGRGNAVAQASSALAGITGSHLFHLHPTLPWIIGGWALLICAAMTYLLMTEPYFERKTVAIRDGFKLMGKTAKSAWKYSRQDPHVRFVIVIVSLQVLSFQALNMYWQPLFESAGFEQVMLGYIFAAIKGSLAIGGFLLSFVNTENRERKFLLHAQTWTGIFIVMAATIPSGWIALAAFLLHEVARGFFDPLRKAYLQSQIPSEERATIVSFCEMMPHIFGAIGLVISGLLAEAYGINVTWMICGAALILGSLFISRMNGVAS